MIRTNESGEIVNYIMEPEEELLALRFITTHKHDPLMIIAYSKLWNYLHLPIIEQAQELNLQGGYKYHFHNVTLGGDFV